MTLIAIETDWDKEITDKVFTSFQKHYAKKIKAKLEKVDKFPTEGSKKFIFIENIEGYAEAKNKSVWRWVAKNRPYENIIIYTCKNWGTIPKSMRMITDFFFTAFDYKPPNFKFMVFRPSTWLDMLQMYGNMGKYYMGTKIVSEKNGKVRMRWIDKEL